MKVGFMNHSSLEINKFAKIIKDDCALTDSEVQGMEKMILGECPFFV